MSIERLLIMRPSLPPIFHAAPRPPQIAEQFLRLGPDSVVIFSSPPLAYERFKLPLRRFVLRRIGGLRRRLRPPQRVGQAKLHPSRLIGLKLDGAGFEVKLPRLTVRGFGIEPLGFRLQSFVGRLLGLRGGETKERKQNQHNERFHKDDPPAENPGYAPLPARSRGRQTNWEPERAWSWMPTIVDDNHSTQAQRHPKCLIRINTSFAETARWERCVPRGRFSLFQCVVNDDVSPSFD